MSTPFTCPSCQQAISAEVPPGTQVQCPLCNQVVTVPGPAGPTADAGVQGVAPGGPTSPSGGPPVLLDYAGPTGGPTRQGLAIAALVCGIVGLLGFCTGGLAVPAGIVGLILGIVALVKIKRKPAVYRGRGMAIAGICTGGASLLIVPLMIAILLPALGRARVGGSKRTVCQANMRGIGQALYIYAQDDGMFPEKGADWQARLVNACTAAPKQFLCPSDTGGSGSSYYYVPGYGDNSDPAQIILYEDPTIHGGRGGNILYQDGHVAFVKSPQYEKEINAITLPDGTTWAPHKGR